MELTAEQKFLKVIAEHFNRYENKEEILFSSSQYLNYLSKLLEPVTGELPIDKVGFGHNEPLKKPEEEKLYKNIDNGAVVEVISVYDYGVVKIEYRGTGHVTDLALDVFLKKFVLVAEPTWKPEVGKLYKEQSGLIGECTNISFGDDVIYIRYLGNKEGFCLSKAYFTPIAELEGLRTGDPIWCIAGGGMTEYYTIESVFSHNLTAYCGKGYVSVYFDGSACMFGNGKQLFFRTADRAERFGKGNM